jgi:hypothetical protein
MKNYIMASAGLEAVMLAAAKDTGSDAETVQGNHEAAGDVTEEQLRDTGILDLITVASLGAKPQPARDDSGKPVTIEVNGKWNVLYPDQDLCVIGGRATGYCFVETDKGTSLELQGDFAATVFVPNHNGEVDLEFAGSRAILPGSADKIMTAELASAGFEIGMTGDIVSNEVGAKRTKITTFADDKAVLFSFIIGAKSAPATTTGYTYTIRMVEQAKKEVSQADMLRDRALKKRKVLQLAAPNSALAQ